MNKDIPLVSVIVLTYNQEGTIGRTLDSILAQQTAYTYEIVIGEDAGTDNTRAICEDYQQRHPDIVRLMPKAANKGVVRNYFDTLRECRGELIADCAGDDYWCDEHKLQKQVTLLNEHPEAAVVHTSWCVNAHAAGAGSTDSQNTAQNMSAPQYIKAGALVRSIAIQTASPVIHLCTALYRKRIVIEALDSDPDLFLSPRWKCEDLQVAYALAKAGCVLYMPEATLCYGVGHESVSNASDELKLYEFFLSATDLAYEIVKREQLEGSDINAYFQSRLFALQMHLLRADCSARLPELQGFASRWQQPLSMKNRLLAFCLTHTVLRSSLLTIRKIYVKMKPANS